MEPQTDSTIAVGYTVEQCWHDSPGGTAIAALRVARELTSNPKFVDEVDLHFVAGKHAAPPSPVFAPRQPVAMLPLGRPFLYEAWTRLNWPKVESVVGRIDVAHATGLIPCATSAPLVVTIHDVAFLRSPEKFSKHGAKLMTRSLDVTRRRADRVICSSQASFDDLVDAGFDDACLRIVPLGVDASAATSDEIEAARRHHDLPERFILFVGTLEPRKNLHRLVEAVAVLRERGIDLPLVVAGADGWGAVRSDIETRPTGPDGTDLDAIDVRFLGLVSDADLRGLYSVATVFAYPSEQEGFGLPVAEAMAHGAPVVTSSGTSTEEVAGGAAVLVDPFDVADIARGLSDALARTDELVASGRERARTLSWERSAAATLAVYRELAS